MEQRWAWLVGLFLGSGRQPLRPGLRRLDFKAPAEQGYLTLAYKVPALASLDDARMQDQDWDALALTVLAAVLDGREGAPLGRALTQVADRVADSAGAGYGLWGRGPQLFTLMAYLRRVTAQQVQAVATRYFGEDHLTIATLLPQPGCLVAQPRSFGTAPVGIRH